MLRVHPVPLVGGLTRIEEPFTSQLWGQCQDAPPNGIGFVFTQQAARAPSHWN
jgi:hypothetical protein